MEPNIEPRRRPENLRTPPPTPQQSPGRPPSLRPTAVTTTKGEPAVSYTRQVCLFMGVILFGVGLIGFVMDNFLGAHLSYAHNIIHVVSGILAIGFGYYSHLAAKNYSYTFGAIYGLLGIIGFVVGQPGMPTVGRIAEDRFLWRIRPEVLEFGTADHIIHLLIAAIFIAGALYTGKRRPTQPTASSR
ncbi:DUF4383 domain-containing protein [Bdellovibrio sp. HCB2-146]|uniref:DUF4383 domain-containing protein n=1 Tax=Bdellovibrio sp. HCB2-146 TaxID=3394362 RepID=UPI0039BC85E4